MSIRTNFNLDQFDKILSIVIVCAILLPGCRAASSKIDKADAHYNAGVSYMEKGNYEKAIESLKNARNVDPKSARIHNALGLVYHNYGLFDKAIECFLISLELKPNAPHVNNNLAASYMQIGEFNKAIEQCNIALSDKTYLSPSAAYFNLAHCYKALGNLKKSKNYFLKSLEEEPNFARAHLGLAKVLKEIKDLRKSVNHLKQAIEINPNYTDAYYELGLILFDLKADQKSKIYFKKVIELSPDSEYSIKACKLIKAIDGRQNIR